MLRLLTRARPYQALFRHRILASVPHPHPYTRTMSAAAVASSSQPSQPPPQNGPHAGPGEGNKQQLKEKKDKAQSAASQYPLEVRPRRSTIPTTMLTDVNLQLQPPPEYIDQRIQLFEKLRAEYDEFVRGGSLISVFIFFLPYAVRGTDM